MTVVIMKLSKEQAALNRQKIIDVAAHRFRERGIDGIGVADVMKEAGFTHGGFYNHFPSKDALAAAACTAAFDGSLAQLRAQLQDDHGAEPFWRALAYYVSADHRDDPHACPMASLAVDAARQSEDVQAAFTEGVEAYLELMTAQLGKGIGKGKKKRKQAMRLLSELVGALVLARATRSVRPELSEAILAATRQSLDQD
jgi:TetR/AcrR family transcriptional regulator, transcriptional repressor for nem operon